MANLLFINAIKDGKYVSINQFKPGEGARCGCICPECGEPVQSNITAKSKEELKIDYTNHFSHVNEKSTCGGGYEETQIHLKAKEIIANNTSISVPGKLKIINYGNVRLEAQFPNKNYKRYRPDIIVKSVEGEDIAIEIVVTCEVTTIKEQLYIDNKFKSFVIDLSFYKDRVNTDSELKRCIIESVKNKKWIWSDEVEEIDLTASSVTTKKVDDKDSILSNPLVWIGGVILGGFIYNMIWGKKRQ